MHINLHSFSVSLTSSDSLTDGKPICVLSAGIHETTIVDIQEKDYVNNVEFMLNQFSAVCDHIIWLGNTSPMSVDLSTYCQTRSMMKSWDVAVKELIASTPRFFRSMSFVDVHDASLTWQHEDNIHMNKEWYQRLGTNLFLPLMQAGSEDNSAEKEDDVQEVEDKKEETVIQDAAPVVVVEEEKEVEVEENVA